MLRLSAVGGHLNSERYESFQNPTRRSIILFMTYHVVSTGTSSRVKMIAETFCVFEHQLFYKRKNNIKSNFFVFM